MPFMTPIRATRAHDQADRDARRSRRYLGASGTRKDESLSQVENDVFLALTQMNWRDLGTLCITIN